VAFSYVNMGRKNLDVISVTETLGGRIEFGYAADRLGLAYEFRQKPDPYAQIPGLIGHEDDWHGFDAAVILSEQATFCAGYGIFGLPPGIVQVDLGP